MSSISLNGASQSLYPLLGGLSGTAGQLATNTPADLIADETAASQSKGAGGGRAPLFNDTALFQQLQQSVANALQSAQGNTTTDPNQIVQQALTKLIQQNSAGSAAASTTNGNSPSPQQALFNTLESYGINTQQFQSDFLAAVQQAQNGQSNPSTAFNSFPSGLSVDTTA